MTCSWLVKLTHFQLHITMWEAQTKSCYSACLIDGCAAGKLMNSGLFYNVTSISFYGIFLQKSVQRKTLDERVLVNRGLGMSPSCYQHAVLYLNFIHMAPKCAKTKPCIWPRFLITICGSLPFVSLEATVDLLTPDTLILCVPHFVPATSRPTGLGSLLGLIPC